MKKTIIGKSSTLLLSALMLGTLSVPAFAEDMTWSQLKSTINGAATGATINIQNNITRDIAGESGDITISKELSIIGSETGKYLSGNNTYKGLTVDESGNLTLQNITMQNFKSADDGGAINNSGIITSITGANDGTGNIVAFKSNNVTVTDTFVDVCGGAINNVGTIESITGNFENNTVTAEATQTAATAKGGAINNSGTIKNITGNFEDNNATATAIEVAKAYGGAINNSGTIENITGKFENNTVTETGGSGSTADGGAIYNSGSGTITSITGVDDGTDEHNIIAFKDNIAIIGGAIYNDGTITSIAGDFVGNVATTKGGAIYNDKNSGDGEITSITGNFSGNSANHGGAIYNNIGTITNITGDFESNSATTSGGAINNTSGGIIRNITGDFKGNHADGEQSGGGAIYNSAKIENITGDFENNYTYAAKNSAGTMIFGGGAIANTKTINISTSNDKSTILFNGNYITNSTGKGGAIWNMNGTVGLYAVNAGDKIEFTGTTPPPTDIPEGVTPYDVDGIYNASLLTGVGVLNINGNGTNTYAGTVILQNVDGDGITNIWGGKVNVAKDHTQKAVTVANGATLTTNGNVTTTDGIANAGILNLLGGSKVGSTITYAIIDSAVSGDGTTIFGNDTESTKFIQANGAITQAVTIKEHTNVIANANMGTSDKNITNNGGLTISADNVKGNIINGSGGSSSVLTLTAGTLSKQISGGANASTIISSGIVIAENTIQQARLSIGSGATLETNANNLVNVGWFYNQGDLNLTGGTLSSENFGSGTTNIVDNVTVGIADGKSVSNLALGSNSTLDLLNSTYNDVITVDTFNAGSNGNLRFDVSVTENDQIQVGTSASGTLNLTGINIDGNNLGDRTSIDLFTADNNDKLSGLTINKAIVATDTTKYYAFTQDASNKGQLNILKTDDTEKPWTLSEVVQAQTYATLPATTPPTVIKDVNTYNLSKDTTLTSALGTLTRYDGEGTRSLTINGNGYTLNGQNNVAGIIVNSDDTDDTLTLNNVNMQNFYDDSDGGGAVWNDGTITNITGNFENNFSDLVGGAIWNDGTIGNITGDFTGNHAAEGFGGAIYNIGNNAEITNLSGNFEGNYADFGGAIFNDENGSITIKALTDIQFKENYASSAGAIANNSGIVNIIADGGNIKFEGNYVKNDPSPYGMLGDGAIYNNEFATVGLYAKEGKNITFVGGEDDTDNEKYGFDGIANWGTLNINDGTDYTGTVNLYTVDCEGITNINGGIVNVAKSIIQDEINVSSGATLSSTTNGASIVANTFVNNGTVNMSGDSSKLLAIDLLTNNGLIDAVNVVADTTLTNDGTINATGIEVGTLLTNNSTIEADNILATEITNNGNITTTDTMFGSATNNSGASLTVNGKVNSMRSPASLINKGEVTFNGNEEKRLELTNSGTANFNGRFGDNSNIQLTQNAGVMNFSTAAVESTATHSINTVVLNGGTLNFQNNSIGTMYLNNVTLNNDINLMLDADLAKGDIDSFSIGSFVNNGDNHINITGFKILSDADTLITSIEDDFYSAAPDGLIKCDLKNVAGYSPIYKYDIEFGKDFDGDNAFIFTRKGGDEGFNPAIMAAPVAAQMGGYLNQLNSYENAFEHMDTYMNMTQDQRMAIKMSNRYASVDDVKDIVKDNFKHIKEDSKSIWFKPYASFEKVNLKGGTKVGNTMYGSFVGGDSSLIELKKGWDIAYSAYASYDGSHQHYEGIGIYQNGAHLGGAATLYKGNFFTGLTSNLGVSIAEASTMFGKDHMTMLMSGVASKTGYNWELLDSRLIVQPNFLMSYSFVNMFDYNNAAGIRIDADPLHAIQIAPGVKFIGNLPNGWQPYASAQMVWNILDETKFQAANVNLPELSVKPYFQYGLGVQKKWGERFTGSLQAMVRNGGRTGVALSAGFRWTLGK